VEIAAQAGADVITVMGITDDATIAEAIKAARRYGQIVSGLDFSYLSHRSWDSGPVTH